ncbi:hypothetical protein ARMGADRAFT_1028392 [Armillaria gallica]|uniref:Uncharacterized protein n=1 Tax=Armillaria gallica TaxID=47427 RepID=A0A2H3DXP5_ARMGA|nr:hypothetical protein ARMGADRAFT_1028392 [Armillaria gallica]
MQTSLPDLSPEKRGVVFHNLDLNLNRLIVEAFLHGLYSGIVTVALWVICSSPKQLRNTFLSTIIITIYVLSTITFGISWSSEHRGFIDHGSNFQSIFTTLVDTGTYDLINSVAGGISKLLVDITIAVQFAVDVNWSLIYIVLMLATMFMCTFLIVYHTTWHTPRISASRKIIKMLIKSSAIYSISLIIYLGLVSHNLESGYYADDAPSRFLRSRLEIQGSDI